MLESFIECITNLIHLKQTHIGERGKRLPSCWWLECLLLLLPILHSLVGLLHSHLNLTPNDQKAQRLLSFYNPPVLSLLSSLFRSVFSFLSQRSESSCCRILRHIFGVSVHYLQLFCLNLCS